MDSLFRYRHLVAACMLLSLLLVAGCDSDDEADQPKSGPPFPFGIPDKTDSEKEQIVLNAVKNYFTEGGAPAPDRIVIKERREFVWIVSAGPEIAECELVVVATTGHVVRFRPGE